MNFVNFNSLRNTPNFYPSTLRLLLVNANASVRHHHTYQQPLKSSMDANCALLQHSLQSSQYSPTSNNTRRRITKRLFSLRYFVMGNANAYCRLDMSQVFFTGFGLHNRYAVLPFLSHLCFLHLIRQRKRGYQFISRKREKGIF